MSNRWKPTWVQVFCLVVFVGAALVLVLPMLTRRQYHGCGMKNNINVRAVVQHLTVWASSHDDQFPKLGAPGSFSNTSTLARFEAMVNDEADPLEACLLVSRPSNEYPNEQTPGQIRLKPDQVSYALLNENSTEWANNTNASAPLVADKMLPAGGSFWSTPWSGSVAWGDSHAGFESDQFVSAKFGGTIISDHDLFTATTNGMVNP